jgi:pimeloyl-ACP methyl ester carboxylesterase
MTERTERRRKRAGNRRRPGGAPAAHASADHHTIVIRAAGHAVRVSVRRGHDPSARPLLMLMGLGGNIEMWEPFRSELARQGGMTTIAFDIPGTGESRPPVVPIPLPLMAIVARGVLTALQLREVDVIGLSWGGLLAQQLAVLTPRRVRRLVLANTNFGIGSVPGGWAMLKTLATSRRYTSINALRETSGVFGGHTSTALEPTHTHARARLARPPSARGYYTQIGSLLGWSSLPWLRLIRQHTLVLCGDDDGAIPLANPRILARLLPHARLEIVPDGGHLMLFDQPADMANVVTRFLRATNRGDPRS